MKLSFLTDLLDNEFCQKPIEPTRFLEIMYELGLLDFSKIEKDIPIGFVDKINDSK